jgi:hypothetical protein
MTKILGVAPGGHEGAGGGGQALTPDQIDAVHSAVVTELLDRFDDPYSGATVLDEAQARLIANSGLS